MGIGVGAGSVSKSITTGSGVDCPNAADSGLDLTVASSLRKDVALGSGMDAVAGSVAQACGPWRTLAQSLVPWQTQVLPLDPWWKIFHLFQGSLCWEDEVSGLDQAGRWLLAMLQALGG